MTTTWQLKERPAPTTKVASPKRTTATRQRSSRRLVPVAARAGRRQRQPWYRALPGLSRAGLSALVVLFLSLLGLMYITQISHVARLGYTLSSIQQQQAKLDRDNALLQYQLASERTLPRANEIATGTYKMQPMESSSRAALATATAGAANAATQPRVRFVAATRPQPTTLPDLAPPTPLRLFDQLWNRLVGVGVARAAE